MLEEDLFSYSFGNLMLNEDDGLREKGRKEIHNDGGLSSAQYSSVQNSRDISRATTNYPQLVCDVCDKQLIMNQYEENEYWNQIYCSSHFYERTPICYVCTRIKASNNVERYIELEVIGCYRRQICPDCYQSAVLDVKTYKSIVLKCFEFFKSLNMNFSKYIPFLLVDSPDMISLSAPKNGGSIIANDGATFRIISYNQRSKAVNYQRQSKVPSEVISCSKVGNRITVKKRPCQRKNFEGKTAVAVLFGRTEAVTGKTLAHEMMHVWLRHKGFKFGELEPKVEEGICQVMGYKWLEWYELNYAGEITSSTSSSSSPSPSRSKKKESIRNNEHIRKSLGFYKMEIELHDDVVYGDGFREAQMATSKYGLPETINHILTHHRLPHT